MKAYRPFTQGVGRNGGCGSRGLEIRRPAEPRPETGRCRPPRLHPRPCRHRPRHRRPTRPDLPPDPCARRPRRYQPRRLPDLRFPCHRSWWHPDPRAIPRDAGGPRGIAGHRPRSEGPPRQPRQPDGQPSRRRRDRGSGGQAFPKIPFSSWTRPTPTSPPTGHSRPLPPITRRGSAFAPFPTATSWPACGSAMPLPNPH